MVATGWAEHRFSHPSAGSAALSGLREVPSHATCPYGCCGCAVWMLWVWGTDAVGAQYGCYGCHILQAPRPVPVPYVVCNTVCSLLILEGNRDGVS